MNHDYSPFPLTTGTDNLSKFMVRVVKLVAIPIDNRIYVIWGSEEKFVSLLNIIQKLKKEII